MIWRLLLAGALGGAVGAIEVGARYRDDPMAALRTPAGILYVLINSAAGAAALLIVEAFGWTFNLGADASALQVDVVRVLVAGLGSVALFRSSLFTVRQGNEQIGIGPSAILTALLSEVDRGVDRRRGMERLNRDDLVGLSFDRDHVALTELCTAALQNLDKADAQALGELAARLKSEASLSDSTKLDCFALQLLTLVGPKALHAAARRIRERRALESSELDVSTVATAIPADLAKKWRDRLKVITPLVERPVQASGQLESGLELAWLYERLEEYDAARELYEELTVALHRTSYPLTDHELQVARARVELSTAYILDAEFGTSLESRRHSARTEPEKWGKMEGMRKRAEVRLRTLCYHPGGRPSSYAAALYILVHDGVKGRVPGETNLAYISSERALGYLTDALVLLTSATGSAPTDHHALICRLHFARAGCFLARGSPIAAADDLFRASESVDRDLQIISASLGGLLLPGLPGDQALALSRVIEPYGFPRIPTLPTPIELDIETLASESSDWHRELAGVLARHLPNMVPHMPLRTFDLIASPQTQIPKSFRLEPSAEEAIEQVNRALRDFQEGRQVTPPDWVP